MFRALGYQEKMRKISLFIVLFFYFFFSMHSILFFNLEPFSSTFLLSDGKEERMKNEQTLERTR